MFHVRFHPRFHPLIGGRLVLFHTICLALAFSACRRSAPPRATTVAIVTGRPGGVFNIVGEALAASYGKRLPGIVATTALNANLEDTLDILERGDTDLAFDDSETTYRAYRKGTTNLDRPHSRIRAIANLFPTVVHIVARSDLAHGGEAIAVPAFEGTRVNVGPPDRPTAPLAEIIFESYSLKRDSVHTVFDDPTDPAADIRTGKIDGIILWTPFHHPLITRVTNETDVRLVPLERKEIENIQERSHFLRSTIIPKGTYRGQTRDVPAVAEDILLLCRSDLSEALVYDLTKALFEATPDLVRAHRAAQSIEPDHGPTTSIPLHPGAARYYRERELPR
jgi:TRAP transporter TAXI family solute receptor